MKEGIVVKSTGSWYLVRLEDERTVECRIRGKFRMGGIRTTNPVAVGDQVEVEENGVESVITGIRPRRNYIIRKSTNLSKEAHILASNVDQALLVVTVNHPVTSTVFIDRFWLLRKRMPYRLCWFLIKLIYMKVKPAIKGRVSWLYTGISVINVTEYR